MKRFLATAAVAGAAALAVAGCGSGTSGNSGQASQTGRAAATGTVSPVGSLSVSPASASPAAGNGTATMSAAQVSGAAIKALSSAKSVRITGTFLDQETQESGQLDMWVTGTAGRGTMAKQGAKVDVIFADGATYFKAGAAALKILTKGESVPPGVLELVANRWFKVSGSQESQLPVLTISALTTELSRRVSSDPHAAVSTGTYAGQPVTIVRYRDGSRLYVTATGPVRPLRLEMTGDDGGHFVFSGYGAPVTATPPRDALDVGQMDQ